MMDLDKNSVIPLYYQLANYLRNLIKNNLLKPGETLPSESELITKFSISRGTVRQALQMLATEGLIERYPGKGSFVSYPKIKQDAVRQMGFFTQALLDVGKKPSAKVLLKEERPANDLILSKLKLSSPSSVVLIKRIRFVDEEPWAIETAFFREDVGRKLLEEDLSHSIYKLLQEKYKYIICSSKNTIEAAKANVETAHLLNIKPGDSILIIRRLMFLVGNEPFEYAIDIYRGDRIAFSVEDQYQQEEPRFKIKPESNIEQEEIVDISA